MPSLVFFRALYIIHMQPALLPGIIGFSLAVYAMCQVLVLWVQFGGKVLLEFRSCQWTRKVWCKVSTSYTSSGKLCSEPEKTQSIVCSKKVDGNSSIIHKLDLLFRTLVLIFANFCYFRE